MSDLIKREDAIHILACEMYAEAQSEGYDAESVEDYIPEATAWMSDAPSAEPKTGDKNELKFYYVESLDDYRVGRRLDNFYYATWHGRLGFVWSHSKYLPWGEHIVDKNTLWKEHTYPSEPIEMPFTEWIVGFVKKYFAEPKTGEWIEVEVLPEVYDIEGVKSWGSKMQCDQCGFRFTAIEGHIRQYNFCPNCGADMRGENHE